jgi:steroid delta-isomerase-like uncharacterized protein
MHTETNRSNKQLVRSLYEVALSMGDMELMDRILTPDYVGPRGEVGPAAFARTAVELRTAFPDIRFSVEDIVEEGDRVAVRWTWTGTHRGPFRGFAPTGRRISNAGFGIFQLRGGRIARSWILTDRLGFVEEVGAVPPELAARLQPRPRKGDGAAAR